MTSVRREIFVTMLLGVILASLVLGAGYVFRIYNEQGQGIGDIDSEFTLGNQDIGPEEHLYLPINVNRITIPGYLLFKYETRGDEKLILYLIGGHRIKEVQNPTGNIGLIYPEPIAPYPGGDSTIEWTPEAELIITRNNGTIEKYSLPIVGGEVYS